MKPKAICAQQSSFLLPELSSQLDPRQPLYALALAMRWEWFEQEFGPLYSPEGRPALPIRRMVGLLMLKHLHNLSDERVVEFWSLSPYAQFFCGEREMSTTSKGSPEGAKNDGPVKFPDPIISPSALFSL